MIEGIDFAGHNQIDYASVAASKRFVCRYLSGVAWKDITLDELHAWNSHGVAVVFVWELGATDPEQGYGRGVWDAQRASAQLRTLGVSDLQPIYFAVDEDTTFGPNLTGYFTGISDTLGHSRVGVYGSYAVVGGAFDSGLVSYGWQTYAWSGGRWDRRAQLQQYSNGQTLGSLTVDLDRATSPDYAGWLPDSSAVPPTPPPTSSNEVNVSALPTLSQGSSGQYVRNLQGLLLAAGRQLGLDGSFGPGTGAVLKEWQGAAGLVADGICGARTWSTLLGV